MSETPVQSTPAPPAEPAVPPHEGLLARAENLLRRDGPAISDEMATLLRGHSAALMHLAATIIEAQWPNSEPVASRVLEVALGVAKAGGIAL